MKKINIFVVSLFALTGYANAGFVGPQTEKLNITTVKDVSKLFDDTHVIMQGKIVNNLGDEKYTFADETGEIIIDIDDEDWNGLTVTPETKIQIYGEVDKGLFKKTKIDVDLIKVK